MSTCSYKKLISE